MWFLPIFAEMTKDDKNYKKVAQSKFIGIILEHDIFSSINCTVIF
jgi:hypothetical protein